MTARGNGVSLLVHGHPRVRRAIEQALDLGLLSARDAHQGQVAAALVPSAELVRFSGSGTETMWHAIRTARAVTGRQKVVKFEGHFHSHNDYLDYSAWPPLEGAGPADAPYPWVESAGIPPAVQDLVVVLPWNDADALERALRSQGDQIAAVIIEPPPPSSARRGAPHAQRGRRVPRPESSTKRPGAWSTVPSCRRVGKGRIVLG